MSENSRSARKTEIAAELARLYGAAFPGKWKGVRLENMTPGGGLVVSEDWYREAFDDETFEKALGVTKDATRLPASYRTTDITPEVAALIVRLVNLMPEILGIISAGVAANGKGRDQTGEAVETPTVERGGKA